MKAIYKSAIAVTILLSLACGAWAKSDLSITFGSRKTKLDMEAKDREEFWYYRPEQTVTIGWPDIDEDGNPITTYEKTTLPDFYPPYGYLMMDNDFSESISMQDIQKASLSNGFLEYVRANIDDDFSGMALSITNYNLFDCGPLTDATNITLGFMESTTGNYNEDIFGGDFMLAPAIRWTLGNIVQIQGSVGVLIQYQRWNGDTDKGHDVKVMRVLGANVMILPQEETTCDEAANLFGVGLGVDVQLKLIPQFIISPLVGFRYNRVNMQDKSDYFDDTTVKSTQWYVGLSMNFQ